MESGRGILGGGGKGEPAASRGEMSKVQERRYKAHKGIKNRKMNTLLAISTEKNVSPSGKCSV